LPAAADASHTAALPDPTFNHARGCEIKIEYARNHGLGGVMIWELAQDYFPADLAGRRHPLLQSIGVRNSLAK
jgi:GH18 family chitinase